MSIIVMTRNRETDLYLPSPEEIQARYESVLASGDALGDMIESVLSDDAPFADQPLLQLGVLGCFAEEEDDVEIFIPAVSLINEKIMPNLTAEQYIAVLSNEGYSGAFKFAIIDIYSYAAASDKTRNSANFHLVDEKLTDFIVPNNDLSLAAMTAIQDLSVIDCGRLADLIENGTEAEQKLALKVMKEAYPEAALAYAK